MPCYNCTSRVLRIFLHDSIAASVSRPQPLLQHYYFRQQQQQRFNLSIRVPFHISQRLQSTLASSSTTPPHGDDDYIPFGPPILTANRPILASDDGVFSGLLPPPIPISTPLQTSHFVYGYEPEVEILSLPEAEPESQAREAESKRTIELIRRKIEASWAREGAVHRSMVETGLPVVGGGVDSLENARLAVLQERTMRGSEGAGEGSRGVKGRDNWKLPTMKEAARREDRRKAKKMKEEMEQARRINNLSPAEERRKLKKMRKKEEGKWGVSKVVLGKPMERRLEPKEGGFLETKEDQDESFKVEQREYSGEVKAQRTILVGRSQIPVPVVKQSLPKPKAKASSIREFIPDEKDPFDRKAFSREKANQRQRSALHNEVMEDFEWEQKRRKRKWELPPIEEVKKESKTDEWGPKQKLQHYVATTPRSELEAWRVQKAALQKKFGMGWAPRKKLSPKARDWVKELHGSVPELTTEKLSEIFKVSPEAIRRILRSKWTPSPEQEQARERRWLKRRDDIWERWIDIGRVQTKGMKLEVQKLKAEGKEKWRNEMGEARERYIEKISKDSKEKNAMLDSASGPWRSPGKKLFQAGPGPRDAGEVMAKEKYARDLQKNTEKRRKRDREYRERLKKAKSSEASTAPPPKLPAESPAKPFPRFL